MPTVIAHNEWPATVSDPMIPMPFRVREVWPELSDTFSVSLEPVDSGGLFRFAPGQFNMLYRFGVGEVPISVSSDPAVGDNLIHTIRAVGPVTRALGQLTPGGMVGLRGPFGTPWPVAEAEGSDVVVLAGGLGLAPLRPAIYRLLANRRRYGALCIYYGARTPSDILFRRELESWRGRFDLTVDVTVDSAGADWGGKVGVVTRLLEQTDFDPTHTRAFVCGPEVMMRFGVDTLSKLGVGHDQIYVSMERNMKCAVGFCGHCQYGASFVCRDGPVFRFDSLAERFRIQEI
jgi:NAD(P)H-flavin reductase